MENNKQQQKRAAVLKYDSQQDEAPRLVARGKGYLAGKILDKAREQDIPIKKDQDLVQALAALEIGQEIPEELYQVVAEILAFIYELEDMSS